MNQNHSKKIEKHKSLFPALLLVLVLLLTALFFSTVVDIQNKIKQGKYIGQEIETKNTITVSDKGEVYAKPDLALSVFSVKSEAKTVAKAMKENTEKMNAVIDFVKNQGVEEKDLKRVLKILNSSHFQTPEYHHLMPQEVEAEKINETKNEKEEKKEEKETKQ